MKTDLLTAFSWPVYRSAQESSRRLRVVRPVERRSQVCIFVGTGLGRRQRTCGRGGTEGCCFIFGETMCRQASYGSRNGSREAIAGMYHVVSPML
jgi:hypothetical protein